MLEKVQLKTDFLKVRLQWWIGDYDKAITLFKTNHDFVKLDELLKYIKLVAAKHIFGSAQEDIHENSVHLSKENLHLFMDMVRGLMTEVNDMNNDDINSGNFGIDDYTFEYEKTPHYNISNEKEFFEAELEKLKSIINSRMEPKKIFYQLHKNLREIEKCLN